VGGKYQNHTDRLACGFKDRPLLDMGFQIGGDRAAADRFGAGKADPLELGAERYTVRVVRPAEPIGEIKDASEHPRANHRRRKAARKPTENLDAWDLYLRALALRYQYTEKSIHEAVALLERALALDPSFAPAAAMIGSCRVHQRVHRVGIGSAGVAWGMGHRQDPNAKPSVGGALNRSNNDARPVFSPFGLARPGLRATKTNSASSL
jgi:hypothetical protein